MRENLLRDHVRPYFPDRFGLPVSMSELDFHPTSTFIIWANAFSPDELAMIEAYGDQLTAEKATVGSDQAEGMRVRGEIRVTFRQCPDCVEVIG